MSIEELMQRIDDGVAALEQIAESLDKIERLLMDEAIEARKERNAQGR